MKLSVVISAFNEEEIIKDCLESVVWADEIVAIDNQSTDKTAKIARVYTDKIFTRENNPSVLNLSKNFGFAKAQGEWILSLDADERVTPELRHEIKQVMQKASDEANGYLIPRKNIIFGKWIKHGLWHPDYQLRLFRKGKGKFPGKHNHELLQIEGKPKKLKSPLVHHNYTSVNQYLKKITFYYSDNEVQMFLESGKNIHWYDAIRMPASDFLANFFARKGYKDGLHGLVLSLLQAFYTLVVFAKIWEKQGFWQYESSDFLQDTTAEFKDKGKELIYWIRKERNKKPSPARRVLLKLFEKILL